jgi:DNA-binding NarL/FixJ family response regulator
MSPAAPRALIVEDDPSWQQIIAELLTDAGLTVDVADNLANAIACLGATAHCLAVVDLSLGSSDHHNQDGLLVLNSLRRHDPACQAILLTGFATVELAVSALTEHGALTCLRKETFQRAQFRELVSRIVASRAAGTLLSGPGEVAQTDHQRVTPLPTVEVKGPEESPAGPQGLILVVEDDAGWRSILAEILEGAGYLVRQCSGYGEALGRLRREKFILAIIDLSLAGSIVDLPGSWEESPPGQNLEGYRLLASARAGRIPTIVVSGMGSPADIERAYAEYDIFAYLQKQTFNRQGFIQNVREAITAERRGREIETLTERERQVLELLAQGLTNKEIAELLVISANTVKRHLKAIFDKLNIHTRAAAAARAAGAVVSSDQ